MLHSLPVMADEIASEYSTFYKKTTKRPKGILFILSLLVILLIGVFVGLRFFSVDSLIASITNNKKQDVSPTPSKTIDKPTPTPTAEPTPDPKVKGKESPTPTGKKVSPTPTTSSKTTTSKLDRSLVTVEVQNGSGAAGAARKISTLLSGLGYKIGSVGNADNFDYTGITIRVKSTKANFLQQLKDDLSKDYTVSSATKDLPSSSTADALVIYGKE